MEMNYYVVLISAKTILLTTNISFWFLVVFISQSKIKTDNFFFLKEVQTVYVAIFSWTQNAMIFLH